MNNIELFNSNNVDVLKSMPENSVDSIVTDPPYGLRFMNKKWDYDVPSVAIWQECLRVLKPGGYLLSFAGSRTYHRMVVRIEDAGFEIRDMIAWIYSNGFPKSHNISKSVGGSKQLDGWGTALKPAIEPIVMTRKPLSEKTVADNVLKHGTGAINIDGCRIESKDAPAGRTRHGGGIPGNGSSYELPHYKAEMPAGRWPANLIHDGSVEVFYCLPQGGDRFFYCAKASKNERGDGNNHPTVKPTDLMRYLCRLVTPPKGVVLDPFMGSGSTGKAAILEGFDFIGIEIDKEYFEIAKKHCDNQINNLINDMESKLF